MIGPGTTRVSLQVNLQRLPSLGIKAVHEGRREPDRMVCRHQFVQRRRHQPGLLTTEGSHRHRHYLTSSLSCYLTLLLYTAVYIRKNHFETPSAGEDRREGILAYTVPTSCKINAKLC